MPLGPLRFTNASGGTSDWISSGGGFDMQSPASAGAIDGVTYLIYAQSFDMSQWEIATGAYTASSKKFARTTILANSLGTTAKINFGNPPQVFVLPNGTDLTGALRYDAVQALSGAQQAQARTNIGLDKLYFSAYLSATQTVGASGVFQKIPFDVEVADPSNWYDNATNFRFQPNIAGKYRIHAQIQASAGTAVSEIDIDIRKTGAIYSRTIILASGVGGSSLIDHIVALNGTTDYIEIFGLVSGTGTLTILGGTAPIRAWFEAQYVGP